MLSKTAIKNLNLNEAFAFIYHVDMPFHSKDVLVALAGDRSTQGVAVRVQVQEHVHVFTLSEADARQEHREHVAGLWSALSESETFRLRFSSPGTGNSREWRRSARCSPWRWPLAGA